MSERKHLYLSLAIQDPSSFIQPVLHKRPKIHPVELDLVRRVEEGYTTNYLSSGKFAFFNKSINEDIRLNNPILRGLNIKLAGNGYGYAVGGYIELEFFLTPTDKDKVPEGFPLVGVDLKNLKLTTVYARPPDSWRKSKIIYQKEKHDEGWLQLKIGINTDAEGNLQTEEPTIKKQEKTGVFGRKRMMEVPTQVSTLIPLPEDKAFDAVLDALVKVCQAVETGVNSLYTYTRRNFEPVGEVQLAYVYPNNPPQILFASHGGDENLAKSYSIFDRNGTRVYVHYIELNKGDIKVRQSKDEPAKGEDTGTRTIDKHIPGLIPKPAPRPVPIESKASIQNGEKEGTISFDDIVGAVEAKKELIRACDYFKNPEEYKKWGISQKAGALLYGPPGTGKTLLARGLANEADAHFMLYKTQEIMSKWSGDSEANLGKLLDEARKHERCILLMDEFDALARKRELSDGSSHGTEGRLVNMLLSFLDGFDKQDNVYLMGTTNRKDVIDDAILQRLYPIEVPLPDSASRAELVRKRVKKHSTTVQINPFGEIDYGVIAKESEGLSGRDLVGEKQGIFLTLLHKAKELTDKNGGKLYLVSTQDWLEEIKKTKQKVFPTKPCGKMGFHKEE